MLLNQTELYAAATGKTKLPPIVEDPQKETNKALDQQFLADWLSQKISQEKLAELNSQYDKLVNSSQNYALMGKERECLIESIKAAAIRSNIKTLTTVKE